MKYVFLFLFVITSYAHGSECKKTLAEAQQYLMEKVPDVDVTNLAELKELRLGWLGTSDEELQYICPLMGLESLSIFNDGDMDKLSGETLGELSRLKQLRYLDLDGNSITGDHLYKLEGLESLVTLKLFDNPIGPTGLGGLNRVPSLEVLTLQGSEKHNLSGNMQNLKELNLHPSLRDLTLMGNDLSDAELKNLSGLSIKSLNLMCNPLNGRGFVHLQEMKNLELLTVGNANIYCDGLAEYSVEGFQHLKKSQLKSLNLFQTGLTKEHYKAISEIQNLEVLSVRKDRFSVEELSLLKDHPNMRLICLSEGFGVEPSKLEKIQKELAPIEVRAIFWQQGCL